MKHSWQKYIWTRKWRILAATSFRLPGYKCQAIKPLMLLLPSQVTWRMGWGRWGKVLIYWKWNSIHRNKNSTIWHWKCKKEGTKNILDYRPLVNLDMFSNLFVNIILQSLYLSFALLLLLYFSLCRNKEFGQVFIFYVFHRAIVHVYIPEVVRVSSDSLALRRRSVTVCDYKLHV